MLLKTVWQQAAGNVIKNVVATHLPRLMVATSLQCKSPITLMGTTSLEAKIRHLLLNLCLLLGNYALWHMADGWRMDGGWMADGWWMDGGWMADGS